MSGTAGGERIRMVMDLVTRGQLERDIFNDGRGGSIRTWFAPPLRPKLGPLLAFGHLMLDDRFLQNAFRSSRYLFRVPKSITYVVKERKDGTHFHFFTFVVHCVFDCGPDAVLIDKIFDLWWIYEFG
jgi:hypothetical protein